MLIKCRVDRMTLAIGNFVTCVKIDRLPSAVGSYDGGSELVSLSRVHRSSSKRRTVLGRVSMIAVEEMRG